MSGSIQTEQVVLGQPNTSMNQGKGGSVKSSSANGLYATGTTLITLTSIEQEQP